jgi:predicted house-cleaning noncanonical NTP pyrophosphatase (MazG superfamily)
MRGWRNGKKKLAQNRARYWDLKSHFFKRPNLQEKLNTALKVSELEYVHEKENEELATFAEIIMRQCVPGKDDELYASASEAFKVFKNNSRYLRNL